MNKAKKIIFVIHDLGITGATLVLFRYIDFACRSGIVNPVFLVNGEGPMEEKLASLGKVIRWGKDVQQHNLGKRILIKLSVYVREANGYAAMIKQVKDEAPDLIYGNTLLSLSILSLLKDATGMRIVCHSHELELAWNTYHVKQECFPIVDYWIANSASSAALLEKKGVHKNAISICYPPLPKGIQTGSKETGVFTVGSSGMAITRKGVDLFMQLAYIYHQLFPQDKTQFVWLGKTGEREVEFRHDIQKSGLTNLTFAGITDTPEKMYSTFDLFVSVSKEESFGMACAEAGSLGVPLLGFENSGGAEELITNCNGQLVPYMDLHKMAETIHELKNNETRLKTMGEAARIHCRRYAIEITAGEWIKSISKW